MKMQEQYYQVGPPVLPIASLWEPRNPEMPGNLDFGENGTKNWAKFLWWLRF
jgi:hypothetical protein